MPKDVSSDTPDHAHSGPSSIQPVADISTEEQADEEAQDLLSISTRNARR